MLVNVDWPGCTAAALIFITIFVLLSAVLMRALLCEGHLLMQDTENKTNNQLL